MDPNLTDDQTFLRDYILNKKYLDNDNRPYDEVTGDDIKEEEEQLEREELFERKYNFRFEEPDQEFVSFTLFAA